jgi:hypothetical protein
LFDPPPAEDVLINPKRPAQKLHTLDPVGRERDRGYDSRPGESSANAKLEIPPPLAMNPNPQTINSKLEILDIGILHLVHLLCHVLEPRLGRHHFLCTLGNLPLGPPPCRFGVKVGGS